MSVNATDTKNDLQKVVIQITVKEHLNVMIVVNVLRKNLRYIIIFTFTSVKSHLNVSIVENVLRIEVT